MFVLIWNVLFIRNQGQVKEQGRAIYNIVYIYVFVNTIHAIGQG